MPHYNSPSSFSSDKHQPDIEALKHFIQIPLFKHAPNKDLVCWLYNLNSVIRMCSGELGCSIQWTSFWAGAMDPSPRGVSHSTEYYPFFTIHRINSEQRGSTYLMLMENILFIFRLKLWYLITSGCELFVLPGPGHQTDTGRYGNQTWQKICSIQPDWEIEEDICRYLTI